MSSFCNTEEEKPFCYGNDRKPFKCHRIHLQLLQQMKYTLKHYNFWKMVIRTFFELISTFCDKNTFGRMSSAAS